MSADTAGGALLLTEMHGIATIKSRLGFQGAGKIMEDLERTFNEALGGRGEVMRIGDSCFCVHVPAIRNTGHAKLAAEKLLRAVEQLNDPMLLALRRELGFGIALHPQHGDDAATLIRHGQLAAGEARREGSRTAVYEPRLDAEVLDSFLLADKYVDALHGGGLQVYFQPKVRISDGSASGAEALLRWFENGKTVAGPDRFTVVAEELGLMPETTWLVLNNALRMSAEYKLPVAVNVTPGVLHHREFPDMISAALAAAQVAPEFLTLEITEGALIVDFGQAVERLQRLRSSGVRISIDDFGTGYSSLSYFRQIPADELKIDKSFVMRMVEDQADQRLVATIPALTKQFGLCSVAEGVETEATVELLRGMGCDYAQGFLYSRAVESAALGRWLTTRIAA